LRQLADPVELQPSGVRNRSFRRKDPTVDALPTLARLLLIAVVAVGLTGCGVVAFPVRTTSAAVKIVPVAGDVVAYPLDKTADAID
jgi:hypothetical protein